MILAWASPFKHVKSYSRPIYIRCLQAEFNFSEKYDRKNMNNSTWLRRVDFQPTKLNAV